MFEFSALIVLPLLATLFCYLIKNLPAGRQGLKIQFAASIVVSLLHLIFSVIIFFGWYKPNLPFFFSFDSLSKLFLLILSNVYFWIVLISFSYLKRPVISKAQEGKKFYFLLLNFYLFANTAAILSNHFGMYWVAAEATTLSVAPLIYYYRNEEALEAMWKYLFLVSIGIAFAFIGILFLVLSSKGTSLEGQQLFFSEFIKKAKELNCQTYDLLGIAPPDQPKHRWAGLTRFKENFGGRRVEIIGSYDKVIDQGYYKLYRFIAKLRRR